MPEMRSTFTALATDVGYISRLDGSATGSCDDSWVMPFMPAAS